MLIQLDHSISLGPTGCGQLSVTVIIKRILVFNLDYWMCSTTATGILFHTGCDLLLVHVVIAKTSSCNLCYKSYYYITIECYVPAFCNTFRNEF